ncbi:MAG TPA: hypothetical protein V6C96_04385 [Vampirovibrionales bacterium]
MNYLRQQAKQQFVKNDVKESQNFFGRLKTDLERLESLNFNLLDMLKGTQSRQELATVLDERMTLSANLQTICEQNPYPEEELPDGIKALIQQVCTQDQELMVFLELEVQKMKGKIHKMQLKF